MLRGSSVRVFARFLTRILLPRRERNSTSSCVWLYKVERIILGLDNETPGADANWDRIINMADVIKIERIILGLD